MSVWIVQDWDNEIDSWSIDPVAVEAKCAQEALQQLVDSGPYGFAHRPKDWNSYPMVELKVADIDGMEFSARVYGPA